MLSRILTASLALVVASPAGALCTYKGLEDAKTTLEQEFRDSPWVVRAHVMSADYHWSDEDESWTLYRLKVVENFKGELPDRFTFFTERNSGGFYMDKDAASPDLDGDFLLFLTQLPPGNKQLAARGALWVNYSCGQSKPWEQLSNDDLRQLRSLSSKP